MIPALLRESLEDMAVGSLATGLLGLPLEDSPLKSLELPGGGRYTEPHVAKESPRSPYKVLGASQESPRSP